MIFVNSFALPPEMKAPSPLLFFLFLLPSHSNVHMRALSFRVFPPLPTISILRRPFIFVRKSTSAAFPTCL